MRTAIVVLVCLVSLATCAQESQSQKQNSSEKNPARPLTSKKLQNSENARSLPLPASCEATGKMDVTQDSSDEDVRQMVLESNACMGEMLMKVPLKHRAAMEKAATLSQVSLLTLMSRQRTEVEQKLSNRDSEYEALVKRYNELVGEYNSMRNLLLALSESISAPPARPMINCTAVGSGSMTTITCF